ncbi:MAG: hypothetical protein JWN34_4333, partial [Bryobacterales bacterium]|nr:hypothetical protein [Bryobacterales bacterium]
VVAIHEDVRVCFDITEHSPDNEPFALPALGSDYRSGCRGEFARAVYRVVVVDVDDCRWQSLPKALNDVGNGMFLVVTGNENSDPKQAFSIYRVSGVTAQWSRPN